MMRKAQRIRRANRSIQKVVRWKRMEGANTRRRTKMSLAIILLTLAIGIM